MSSEITVGAYMITRDEESCLGDCLKSLKGFDDIVILDTGSKDIEGMRKITDKYDCRYLTGLYQWVDDYAEARNEAMKYAQTDWLIVIDSDEVFKGSIKRIKDAIKANPEVISWSVKCTSKKNAATHCPQVRLHKNCKELFWSAPWHNYLSVQGQKHIDPLQMEIIYGYSDAHAKDPDRAIRIGSKYVLAHPECKREKYYLAREYYYRKHYKMAILMYEYYLEDANFPAEITDAHLWIAKCYKCLGDISKAKDACLQAIKRNGNFREAWIILASLSGPGNKKRFNEIAKTASNESVLFVRC